MNSEIVTLHCATGGSDKVYVVMLNGQGTAWTVDFRYGRRVPGPGHQIQGNNGGTKTPNAVTYAEALAKFQDLVHTQQTVKGYTIVSQSSGADGTAVSAIAPVSMKEVSGKHPQLLNEVKNEEQALQLCNNPSYCAQEKMDGERREIERLSGMQAIRGINRKGEYVEIPQTVRNSAETIMLNAFLIDGEEVGEKLFVFDLLKQNDEHMYEVPQRSRYERLRQLIPRSDENIKVVPTAFSSAEKLALFNEVKERGGEGIVFKLVAAPYQEGKSKYALKWKFKAQATMGVISVHKTKRSVQVAASTEEGFQVVGNVTIPVNKDVPVVGQLVEIEYLYFFAGGSLFQPTYKGPRPDKDEADAVSSLKLKVAHPDDETEEEAAA